jgi:hypothetical protein
MGAQHPPHQVGVSFPALSSPWRGLEVKTGVRISTGTYSVSELSRNEGFVLNPHYLTSFQTSREKWLNVII